MENTPAISVVIPMYNAEKYLAECLDSVLAQTFQDFEVILVNDCSTDSSRAIAESYLEKFGDRLKIYDNEKNSGAGGTRNNGLLKAAGEYVYFMDADDLILANGLERLYKVAKNFDVDFVNSTQNYKMNNDGKNKTLVNLKPTAPTNAPILEYNLMWRLKGLLVNNFFWAPWRKLVRREFLITNKIFFPNNLKRCEDEIWTTGLLFNAKKIIHVPIAMYLYRLSSNSITRVKRTALQDINSRVDNIIHDMKWLDLFIKDIPFFKSNPQYHYAVLEYFTNRFFRKCSNSTMKVAPTDMYRAIWQEFGKNFGEYEHVIPILCTLIGRYRKIVEENKIKISELEEQLKAKEK